MKPVLNNGALRGRIPLAELGIGVRARLCEAAIGTAISSRLADLGFVPGTALSIIRRAPLGDPVELDIRGYRLCLRLDQIEGLFVALDPNDVGA